MTVRIGLLSPLTSLVTWTTTVMSLRRFSRYLPSWLRGLLTTVTGS